MDKIRIFIADDEKLIRDGLKIILESYGDIEVTALAKDGADVLEKVRLDPPDLVLMDIRMPLCDGVEATRNIRREFSRVKILILTTFTDTEYIQEALQYGASGYLLKDSDYDVIHEAIKGSVIGNVVFHPDIATKMLEGIQKPPSEKVIREHQLSEKDLHLIRLVAEGLSNQEISDALFLSEGTVKNQISHLLGRLELRDRTQLAAFAWRSGLAQSGR